MEAASRRCRGCARALVDRRPVPARAGLARAAAAAAFVAERLRRGRHASTPCRRDRGRPRAPALEGCGRCGRSGAWPSAARGRVCGCRVEPGILLRRGADRRPAPCSSGRRRDCLLRRFDTRASSTSATSGCSPGGGRVGRCSPPRRVVVHSTADAGSLHRQRRPAGPVTGADGRRRTTSARKRQTEPRPVDYPEPSRLRDLTGTRASYRAAAGREAIERAVRVARRARLRVSVRMSARPMVTLAAEVGDADHAGAADHGEPGGLGHEVVLRDDVVACARRRR